MSAFVEFIAGLLVDGAVEAAIGAPGREDERHIRGFPRSADDASALMTALPRRVGHLGRIPRSELEVWYRGSGKQASLVAIDVTGVGFDDVRAFLTEAVERSDDGLEEFDLEGELFSVAVDEGGPDGVAGCWGLAGGVWVLMTRADSAETRDLVTRAVVETMRSLPLDGAKR